MKKFIAVKKQEVRILICDGCGLEAGVEEGYEFEEFITIEHRCGYGAIHGDGKQLSIDLCQHCFAGMCGDMLTVIGPEDNQAIDYGKGKLHECVNLIRADEKKSWGSYFAQVSPETNEVFIEVSPMINESSNSDVLFIENSHQYEKKFPSYFDVDQISRLAMVDEKKGKEMWDLMFEAIHEYNKAQVGKKFPTRKFPF